ncbi:hypothetical protein OIU79_013001 [Salix purpurea]|uniref:DUF4283 domain-containing protein n=1 Tax=Salix purpurea TaxID=77065 RepID=A0A9Q0Q518_SALPP|nr:hypothetical protein OIU79_013001 [Salix purpurea]
MGPPHTGHHPKTPTHKGPQNNTTRPPNPKKAAQNPTTKPADQLMGEIRFVSRTQARGSLWTSCQDNPMGFFPGSRLPYHVVSSIASRVWQKHGLVQTMTTEKGFYLFQFHDEEDPPLEPTSDGHTDEPKEQEPIPIPVEQQLSTTQPHAKPTCPPLVTSQTLPQQNPNTQVLKKDKMVVTPQEEPRSTTEASSSGVKQTLAAAPQGAMPGKAGKLDSSQSQNSGDPSSESQEFVADSATTTDNVGKHAGTKNDHQQENSPTLSQKAVKKKKGARKRKEAMGL